MPVRLDPEGAELAALRRLANFRGKRVLEIGCGDGRLTWRYAAEAAQVVGIDPLEEEIGWARRHTPKSLKGRVRFEVSQAEELKFPDDSFDIVLYAWSL
ncbi:MAG: class I SAM-dependent methyltransferase [Chloroflexi bacterium]|nr:class I SAM-dependent methyltransferase [Chloroflexota bacterium]